MSSFYLVDGSGYIFRAYYAVRPLSNSKGLPTNALFGFIKMFVKLLRDLDPSHIAVAFDTGKPTFRHQMYSEYKANRGECPEDLVPQMPYFRKIVQAMGLKSLEQEGYEADDIIATLVNHYESDFEEITIISGDKDLTQLVNSKVKIWDPMRDVIYDEAKVEDKFGVKPTQMIDYLSLCGDSSDNIPGVKGVGEKTASKLLQHFGSIEKLISKIDEIEDLKGLRGKASLKEKIESDSEILDLSKQLVTLDKAVPDFSKKNGLDEYNWSKPEDQNLVPLFEELEFEGLLKELGDFKPAQKNTAEKSYHLITEAELDGFVAKLSKVSEFAFDTETTSLNIFEAELVGISFSWEKDVAYYLPLKSNTGEVLDAVKVKELLNPIFSNPKIKKIGVNLKYDVEILNQHGYLVEGIDFDGMLASYILTPDIRQHGLKKMAKKHLGEVMVSFDEMLGDAESILDVPLEELSQYASHDADASFALKPILLDLLKEKSSEGEHNSLSVFREIEMPLVAVLTAMEQRGIKIDSDYLNNLGAQFSSELGKLESEIYELAGTEFNINSPKQLSEVLFEKLKISTTGVKKRQSGYSTDVKVLTKLAEKYEIAEKLLEYRELFKLNTTYVESLKSLINQDTGRIYTSFNQAIAATGRLSSSDPNLQNIPIRNERGRLIREAFVAEDGWTLLSVDYSQIELRVLAHLSEDKVFQKAYKDNEDIHTRTAKEIFGIGISDEELKEFRRFAKTINFGIIYGMSAFRLAGELGISRKQAQEYIDQYFSRYPKVLEYYERLEEEMDEKGYVETIFGRRRYLNDIDASGRDAGYLRRSLINAPLQGSAAEIIKIAMIELRKSIKDFNDKAGSEKIRMLLQVHDELVFEVENSVLEEAKSLIVEEMESAVELDVPLKVDARYSRTWGGAT